MDLWSDIIIRHFVYQKQSKATGTTCLILKTTQYNGMQVNIPKFYSHAQFGIISFFKLWIYYSCFVLKKDSICMICENCYTICDNYSFTSSLIAKAFLCLIESISSFFIHSSPGIHCILLFSLTCCYVRNEHIHWIRFMT